MICLHYHMQVYNDDLIMATVKFVVQPIEVFYKLSNINIHKSPDNIPSWF